MRTSPRWSDGFEQAQSCRRTSVRSNCCSTFSNSIGLRARLKRDMGSAMGAVGNRWSDWTRKAGGWTLLAVGIAGCILPVIPGVPFLIAGLIILARDYRWARFILRRVKRWVVQARRRARARRAAADARTAAGVRGKGVGEA
ncbi:MAG TPA: PGPGW domain-containing protein [Acidobacteriaceae bacterium]